ncbi:hypothetical protein GQ457_06G042890 [Hibiscus cannabinus]
MSESDLGHTYIWTINCILFICVAVGGGCLLVYMTSAEPQSSNLLPVLGFVLVCMPWLFWIITIVYRITSRAFGFRMVTGNLYGKGEGSTGGDGGATVGDNDIDGAEIVDAGAKTQPNSPKNGGRGIEKGSRHSSSSSNDVSIDSHESEKPLSSSKAS